LPLRNEASREWAEAEGALLSGTREESAKREDGRPTSEARGAKREEKGGEAKRGRVSD